jgi:uncharacterized protein
MVILEVMSLCKRRNIPEDHGIEHAIKVMTNASRALSHFKLGEASMEAVLLAALLHDVDDRKFTDSRDYEYARGILHHVGYYKQGFISTATIKMISLVSCCKNGNDIDSQFPAWYYIPRDADRLEALGYNGIKRAHDVTVSRGGQFWLPDTTPRCKTEDDLSKVASKERYDQYKATGTSASLIDHFYDKLLHVHKLSSGCPELQEIANERRQIMVDFVLEFGRTGTINWSKWI